MLCCIGVCGVIVQCTHLCRLFRGVQHWWLQLQPSIEGQLRQPGVQAALSNNNSCVERITTPQYTTLHRTPSYPHLPALLPLENVRKVGVPVVGWLDKTRHVVVEEAAQKNSVNKGQAANQALLLQTGPSAAACTC